MGKVGTKKKAQKDDKSVDDYLNVINAKRMFIGATINLSWRLALTVLIPLVGGIKIDQHFDTSPSYTLAGIVLAVAGGCAVVWSSVKEVNQLQAEEENKEKS